MRRRGLLLVLLGVVATLPARVDAGSRCNVGCNVSKCWGGEEMTLQGYGDFLCSYDRSGCTIQDAWYGCKAVCKESGDVYTCSGGSKRKVTLKSLLSWICNLESELVLVCRGKPDLRCKVQYELTCRYGKLGCVVKKCEALPSRIHGYCFEDKNRNGQNEGEPGCPGWTVWLDDNENGRCDSEEPKCTTNEHGEYWFEVPPGKVCRVRCEAPPKYKPTTGPCKTRNGTSGDGYCSNKPPTLPSWCRISICEDLKLGWCKDEPEPEPEYPSQDPD